MKIAEEYKKHEQLWKDNYLFDPEREVFFTENKATFKHPKDYEHWEVEQINPRAYLATRMEEMGATDRDIVFKMIGGVNLAKNEKVDQIIFQNNPFGDIGIMQYGLDRVPHTFSVRGTESTSSTNREEYHYVTRHSPETEKITGTRYDFTKAKVAPFWPPNLIEHYEEPENSKDFESEFDFFDTLILTEGMFKAFAASLNSLPVMGLTSIAHFRDKKTDNLHPEIFQYLKKKKCKKFVILWDGDCRNISETDLKEKNDLAKRPNQFYSYAAKIQSYVTSLPAFSKLQIFFATINTDESNGYAKGIDDLLLNKKNNVQPIIDEFRQIGEMPGQLIQWIDISTDKGLKKMREFFNLNYFVNFYEYHKEKIKDSNFVFQGNSYEVKNGRPIQLASAELKSYLRIGDDFYQQQDVPMSKTDEGEVLTVKRLVPRKKETIIQDHGKRALDLITRHKGFVNIPDHVNYQQVIHGYWNLYFDVKHPKESGPFPHIEILLKHLFQEYFDNEMIYDYFSVLWRMPKQKLPIIALVSKANNTGKSTFMYLVNHIFKENAVVVSNSDLANNFNSHWIDKLVVMCEETILEKPAAWEKLKSTSTADIPQMREEKNKGAAPIEINIHYILASNHEKNFLKVSEYDTRLWVLKAPSFAKEIKDFKAKLLTEIPSFVNFIENRKIKYEYTGARMFFDPKDYRTKAFNQLAQASEPGLAKDLRAKITELFLATKVHEIRMGTEDIKNEFGLRQERNYIDSVLENFLNYERDKNPETGKTRNTTYSYSIPDPAAPGSFLERKRDGRFYAFKIQDFVDPNEYETGLEIKAQTPGGKQLKISNLSNTKRSKRRLTEKKPKE